MEEEEKGAGCSEFFWGFVAILAIIAFISWVDAGKPKPKPRPATARQVESWLTEGRGFGNE